MGKILALYRLTRFNHAVMLAVAALVGQVVALGRIPDLSTVLFLSLFPPVFVEMASFAINDYFDLGTDRLAKKIKRPLVSGELKPRDAIRVTAISFAIGILASYAINTQAFLITIVFSVMAFLYSYRLKDLPLVGNATIAASSAIPFVYGNFVVSPILSPAVLALGAIAFIASLGRELTITIQDMEADRLARRARTLPIIIGVFPASLIAFLLFLGAAALSAYPFLYIPGFAGDLAYALPVAGTDLLFLYVGVRLVTGTPRAFYAEARKLTFAGLALGLLGFALGAVL